MLVLDNGPPPSPASLVAPGEDLAESQARLDEDLRLNPPGPAPATFCDAPEDDPLAPAEPAKTSARARAKPKSAVLPH